MYLIRTNDAVHSCRNGQLVVLELPSNNDNYAGCHSVVWVEEGPDGQRERIVANYSSREEAEDTQDDIFAAWSRDRAADISY